MSKYTKEPWFVTAASVNGKMQAEVYSDKDNRTYVATLVHRDNLEVGEILANAKLIAASPRMYSICERLGNVGLIDGDGNLHGELEAVLNDAAALIRELDLETPRATPAAILDGTAA